MLSYMEFKMHESGLHFFDSRDKEFNLVTQSRGTRNVSRGDKSKGAEVARTLYATLSCPSWKEFKWIIRSNQIKDCPLTVQDVDNALKIWGENICGVERKEPPGTSLIQ
jgi:hypothetical protein